MSRRCAQEPRVRALYTGGPTEAFIPPRAPEVPPETVRLPQNVANQALNP